MGYIRRILVEPFRCVPQLDIDLSVAPQDLADEKSDRRVPPFRHLIITGPNGSGKTSLIREIAEVGRNWLGRASDPFYATQLDQLPNAMERFRATGEPLPQLDSGVAIRLAILWDRSWSDVRAQRGLLWAFRGAREVLEVSSVSSVESGKRVPSADPRSFLQYLVNLKAEQAFLRQEQDAAGADAIERFFERLQSLVRRILQDSKAELSFVRSEYNFQIKRSNGISFDFNHMADGHAASMAIVAQLTLRIAMMQHQEGDPTLQPEGVVLVDEIEAHLHPSMQRQILPILTEFFPTLQFIVATHSPGVIGSIPFATVVDLGSRQVVRSEDLMGMRYGAILKGHFGLSEDLDADSAEKLVQLRSLANVRSRTPEQQQEFDALADELSGRSAELGSEIWLLKNGFDEPTRKAS